MQLEIISRAVSFLTAYPMVEQKQVIEVLDIEKTFEQRLQLVMELSLIYPEILAVDALTLLTEIEPAQSKVEAQPEPEEAVEEAPIEEAVEEKPKKPRNTNQPWNRKDDELLISLKEQNEGSKYIADVLGRTAHAVNLRYFTLKKKGE